MGVTGNGEGGLRERHAAGPFMLQREHLLDLSKSACRAQTAEGQALGSRSGARGRRVQPAAGSAHAASALRGFAFWCTGLAGEAKMCFSLVTGAVTVSVE